MFGTLQHHDRPQHHVGGETSLECPKLNIDPSMTLVLSVV